jgi:hypothetical protein
MQPRPDRSATHPDFFLTWLATPGRPIITRSADPGCGVITASSDESIPIRRFIPFALAFVCLSAPAGGTGRAQQPPFGGTVFDISTTILTSADPTAHVSTTYAGTGVRLMFDRRTNSFGNFNVHLFNTVFADGLTTEVDINTDDYPTQSDAAVQANKYSVEVGRLPTALRRDVDQLWIHKGDHDFGGGAATAAS